MVRVLAYADDNLHPEPLQRRTIQEMLNKINDFAKWAGLNFNPAKCGALSMINNSNRKYAEPFQPKLGPDLLPALKWEDHYRYLGVQSGRQRSGTKKELEESLTLDASKILDSGLTEWQKIDAINTFLLTKANYNLNASVLDRTWATRIDAKIRRLVKKAMRLPRRTVSAFFHTAKDHGGLGLTSLEDTLDMARITRFLCCLSSPDRLVQDTAWAQLSAVVKKRQKKVEIDTSDIETFINSLPPPQEGSKGDVKSL